MPPKSNSFEQEGTEKTEIPRAPFSVLSVLSCSQFPRPALHAKKAEMPVMEQKAGRYWGGALAGNGCPLGNGEEMAAASRRRGVIARQHLPVGKREDRGIGPPPTATY